MALLPYEDDLRKEMRTITRSLVIITRTLYSWYNILCLGSLRLSY
jgi:hypothetical protein